MENYDCSFSLYFPENTILIHPSADYTPSESITLITLASIRLPADLYTFDADEASAAKTYERVTSAYERLFRRLELPLIKGKDWDEISFSLFCKPLGI